MRHSCIVTHTHKTVMFKGSLSLKKHHTREPRALLSFLKKTHKHERERERPLFFHTASHQHNWVITIVLYGQSSSDSTLICIYVASTLMVRALDPLSRRAQFTRSFQHRRPAIGNRYYKKKMYIFFFASFSRDFFLFFILFECYLYAPTIC